MSAVTSAVPEVGELVRVRGQQWVVTQRRVSAQPRDELATTQSPGATLLTLSSVSDDDLGEELTLAWDIEPGRELLPETQLPDVSADGWDDPHVFGAFLDAVRWGTVASADDHTLQAPFRAGITIEDYQLEPVAKALAMPRVNLLIADDVGLGKTIEAGLVIQEMILRHRARRVLVVCPAPLTGKWRDEMADRFGLDFTVLDAAALKALRRSHGLEANPFQVFSRTIISLPWSRTPRVQRLLDEVLAAGTGHPGFFDILVVDEAHHCAPPAPSGGRRLAVESQQTRAVRRLGEHSQHRLFLSATPHNGYSESWQALLEMLDPQRFARGVEPDRALVAQVMVRRLKDDLVDADGRPRFPGREPRSIDVVYSDDERLGHELLEEYSRARRRIPGEAAAKAGDLISLLLKKRLFSSPAAFAHTLEAHRRTVAEAGRAQGGGEDDVPDWLSEALDWDDDATGAAADDEAGAEAELELLSRAASLTEAPDEREQRLLSELSTWARRRSEPADSKANRLVEELTALCRAGASWTDERVIVFTEYRDTQTWLAGLLGARGFGGDRLGLLYGGMDDAGRDHLKRAFQAAPDRDPVRILLATDAASEGIDLQAHCHRVLHYDIPFNPNRLEQRIGRVDRYGQTHVVDVAHFVGAGWQEADAGSYEADLEFLSRVARKVATERRDLGSINPVLAHAVEARMLGRPVFVDPLQVSPKASTRALRAEQDLRAQAQRLRAQLDRSVARLHVAPANVRRVLDVALDLAGQPPLQDAADGTIEPPVLRSGWERTVEGLVDPLEQDAGRVRVRHLTVDPALVAGRDDVVLAHLGHPLVAQSTRLLRSAVWGGRTDLRRATAVRFTPPGGVELRGPLVAIFARLVVISSDGNRLHEEVLLAARELPESGRGRRIDLEQRAYADLRDAVETALDPGACRLAPEAARHRLAAQWPDLQDALVGDVQVRAIRQREALARSLDQRLEADVRRTHGIFDQLTVALTAALEGPGDVQLTLDGADPEERQQLERDRLAWQARLDRADADRAAEVAALARRYADVKTLVFPFAVALCVPDGVHG